MSANFIMVYLFVCILYLYRGPYNGDSTCITYDAVNAAYLDARKRIRKLYILY